MIDSLGGILTKGLLGNGPGSMILGKFNLGFGIEIIITPDAPVGHAIPNLRPHYDYDREEDTTKFVTIKLNWQGNPYTKTYQISDSSANILIRLGKSVKSLSEKTSVVFNKFIVKPIKYILKINPKDFSNK